MSTTIMHTNRMAMAAADTIITARSEIGKRNSVRFMSILTSVIFELFYTKSYNFSYCMLL